MKSKLMKRIIVGTVAAMLMVTSVCAAPSVTNKVVAVEQKMTVTTETGKVVENAVLTVVPVKEAAIEGEEKKEVVIINEIPEEAKEQVEMLSSAMDVAIEKADPEEFTKVILEMVKEEQIELQDETDTFNIDNMKPLTEIYDLVLMDENGNVIQDVKDVDVKLEVQSLVEDMGEVRIMHYETELEKWVIIIPEVDYESKTLEFHVVNPGPIMVVYEPVEKVIEE